MCSMFYEANERPRHATTTVVIRSKPIAPETDGFTSLLDTSYIGRIDKTTVHDDLAMHPSVAKFAFSGFG